MDQALSAKGFKTLLNLFYIFKTLNPLFYQFKKGELFNAVKP